MTNYPTNNKGAVNQSYIPPASKKSESEIWECRLMGEFIYPRRVEFSPDEVQMLRELSHKTGYPRDHVIREAVRRLYDHIMYRV